MKLNNVDAEDFLAFVHDIDLGALAPDPVLEAALAKLPGRKFVFTNGFVNFAKQLFGRFT